MDYFTKSRVEAFSDVIFAIIITLLVLEIKVPHIENHNSPSDLFAALLNLVPKIAAWVISFVTVCVIWVNHHRIFASLEHVTPTLFWLNANLLLWTSFIPFPTALMGDYSDNSLAVSFYGVVSFFIGIAFLLICLYMWKVPEVTKNMSKDDLWIGVRNVIFLGLTPYLIGIIGAWFSPFSAFACYLFVSIYHIFPKSSALEQKTN